MFALGTRFVFEELAVTRRLVLGVSASATVKEIGPSVVSSGIGWFAMALIVGFALTRVLTVAELFAVFGSAVLAVTATVLLIVPAAVGVVTIVMAAELFAVRVPRLQLTMFPLREQTPMLDCTETKVALAGNELVTFTPLAADGPRFATAIE